MNKIDIKVSHYFNGIYPDKNLVNDFNDNPDNRGFRLSRCSDFDNPSDRCLGFTLAAEGADLEILNGKRWSVLSLVNEKQGVSAEIDTVDFTQG